MNNRQPFFLVKTMNKNDVQEKIQETLKNIREDRNTAKKLLQPIILMVEKDSGNRDLQRDIGQVANKYIENIQKSNEQLIKLVQLMQKSQDDEAFDGFSAEETNNIFSAFENDERIKIKEKEEEDG